MELWITSNKEGDAQVASGVRMCARRLAELDVEARIFDSRIEAVLVRIDHVDECSFQGIYEIETIDEIKSWHESRYVYTE